MYSFPSTFRPNHWSQVIDTKAQLVLLLEELREAIKRSEEPQKIADAFQRIQKIAAQGEAAAALYGASPSPSAPSSEPAGRRRAPARAGVDVGRGDD